MKIGVTGTRSDLTNKQCTDIIEHLTRVYSLCNFDDNRPELHHGDCVGADESFAEIGRQIGFKTVCHPPVDDKLRAFHASDEVREPATYFARNRNIVDECDVLLVAPYQDEWQSNGGTWYTHDYAKKKSKPLIVFWPSKSIFD